MDGTPPSGRDLVAVVGAEAGDALERVPEDRVLRTPHELAPRFLHVRMLRRER